MDAKINYQLDNKGCIRVTSTKGKATTDITGTFSSVEKKQLADLHRKAIAAGAKS